VGGLGGLEGLGRLGGLGGLGGLEKMGRYRLLWKIEHKRKTAILSVVFSLVLF